MASVAALGLGGAASDAVAGLGYAASAANPAAAGVGVGVSAGCAYSNAHRNPDGSEGAGSRVVGAGSSGGMVGATGQAVAEWGPGYPDRFTCTQRVCERMCNRATGIARTKYGEGSWQHTGMSSMHCGTKSVAQVEGKVYDGAIGTGQFLGEFTGLTTTLLPQPLPQNPYDQRPPGAAADGAGPVPPMPGAEFPEPNSTRSGLLRQRRAQPPGANQQAFLQTSDVGIESTTASYTSMGMASIGLGSLAVVGLVAGMIWSRFVRGARVAEENGDEDLGF